MTIRLEGDLAGILTLASNAKTPPQEDGVSSEVTNLVAGVCNHLNLADGSEAKVSVKNQGLDLLFNAYDITDVHLRSRTA